jgi:hypothetical protein
MGTLPKYITANLSEFLDQEELFSCFLVNKHWNHNASEIWQNLCVRKLGFLPEIKLPREILIAELKKLCFHGAKALGLD